MKLRESSACVLLALGAVLNLPAQAAIPDASGVITACYNAATGGLRVIDPVVASCRTAEVALQWSVQGPQGPAGATGATGSTGAQGPAGTPLAWAHVNANGTIDRNSGNISVSRIGDGMYCVGVTGGVIKSVVATLDSLPNLSGAVQAGIFNHSSCPAGATDILVVTRVNAAIGGMPGDDRAFYLLVN